VRERATRAAAGRCWLSGCSIASAWSTMDRQPVAHSASTMHRRSSLTSLRSQPSADLDTIPR
jgi:hypothetical protein